MTPAMKINLANRKNYGEKRPIEEIKYIALHYTANDGDSDEGNANYFHNHIVKASAHYFVDDDSITQSVPDDSVAWSVGGNLYADCAKTGGGKLFGVAKNQNTINIEMCDTIKDGVVKAQDLTIKNTIWLVRKKMKQYNIDINHVIRHFDVNGKHCPAYLMDEEEWKKFKARILGYEIGSVYKVTMACYLRGKPAGVRIGYTDTMEAEKKKCKNVNGFAKLKCGKTFMLRDIEVIGSNVWGKTRWGYWVPLKYKGVSRAKKK